MTLLIIFIIALIAALISAIEAHTHGFARLYNRVARLITLKTKYNINLKIIPPENAPIRKTIFVGILFFLLVFFGLILVVFGYDMGKVFSK